MDKTINVNNLLSLTQVSVAWPDFKGGFYAWCPTSKIETSWEVVWGAGLKQETVLSQRITWKLFIRQKTFSE